MPNRHFAKFLLFLFLLVLGLALVGCSDDEETTLASADPGSTGGSGDIHVVTDPEQLMVPWTISHSSGNSFSGVNDFRFRDQDPGDYTISWPDLAGWNRPRYGTVTKTLTSGSDLSFAATYLPLPGTVQINIYPSGLDAPWLLTGPNDFELAASGDTTLVSLFPGLYTMEWGFVAEFDSLAVTEASLSARTPMYLEAIYGTVVNNIFVSPTPVEANAPWSISGPDGFTASGSGPSSVAFTDDGDYTVTWGDLDGYFTPEPMTISVRYILVNDPHWDGEKPGGPSGYSLTGEYWPHFGDVMVDATRGETHLPWSLTGPTQTTQIGAGDTELTGLRPGDYTVQWWPQDGWVVPEMGETLELASDGSITFTISAEAAVTVRPLPSDLNASWQLSGPGGFSQDGSGEMLIGGLAAGSYTITWNEATGWTAPASSSQTLAADHGLVFEEEYTQGEHTLFVNPKPVSLDIAWEVIGPADFSQSGVGASTLSLTDTGNYTIIWGDVAGYTTPGPEMAIFSGENNLEFHTRYQTQMELVRVAEGNFIMGSVNTEACRNGFETRHFVSMPKAYFIKTTEVTNFEYIEMAQWAYDHGYVTVTENGLYDNLDGSTVKLMDLNDGDFEIVFGDGQFSVHPAERAHHPVKEISWYGAVSYCDWLSLYRGFERAYNHATWECGFTHPTSTAGFRLPTEAEWEKASRAGSNFPYSNGVGIGRADDVCFVVCHADGTCLEDLAWFDSNSGGWSHEVGQLMPNEWGIYDMHGNISEWCNDWNMDNYYADQSPRENPPGPLNGTERIVRGGYFYSPFENCRNAARGSADPSNAAYHVGFRVVLTDSR
jgi:formylglycine-generating enzyme required for sulfatase activity